MCVCKCFVNDIIYTQQVVEVQLVFSIKTKQQAADTHMQKERERVN